MSPLTRPLNEISPPPITDDEIIAAVISAKQKLARIIEREGDMGGLRRKPEYLEQLIAEQLTEKRFKAFCLTVHNEIKKEMPRAEAAGQI